MNSLNLILLRINWDFDMSKKKIFTLILLLFSTSYTFSMVYDNRFFPLYKRPYSKKIGSASRFAADFFATSANEAIGRHEDIIPIPRIFGSYRQDLLGKALMLLGCENPLRDELQTIKLPWIIEGKIKSQGVSFLWDQAIGKYFYIGASWFVMSVHSFQEFCFDRKEAYGGIPSEREVADIYDARFAMHDLIGIKEQNAHESGISDIDFYVRVGNIWEYLFRFRRIDAGFSAGALLPAGKMRNIDIPASVPFGGNGHYGMYIAGDAEFELKEDLKLGFLARFSKRFSRTCTKRLPIAKEHLLYGALKAPVKVSPGFNVVFAPYFSWEYLRKGLGVRVGYTLSYHDEDCWKDCRSAQEKQALPAEIERIVPVTKWAQDYVNLYAFYDFGNVRENSSMEPIAILSWDVPAFLFTGRRVPKMHRISLGVEVNF